MKFPEQTDISDMPLYNHFPSGRIIFAAAAMTVLVSGTNLAAKAATFEIDPWTVVFFRYVIAMISIKALLIIQKRKVTIDWSDWPSYLLLTLSGILLNQIFFVWGLKYTIPSHPSLLYATTSFWVMLMLFIVKKQRPGRRHISAAVLAIGGVAVVLGKNLLVFNADIFRGDLIILGAVLSWATYTAFGADMVKKYGALQLTYILLGLGTAVYLPVGLLSIQDLRIETVSLQAWLGVAYMGVFTSALSYILYYFLLHRINARNLSLLIAAQPPTTIILSIRAGYETFEWNLIAGMVLIAAAIVLSSIKFKERPWAV